VINGWHVLEAWTQTSDAISPTKARPVHVNVNNAGGETKKMEHIEDLRTAKKPDPIVLSPLPKSVDPGSAVLTARPAGQDATANLKSATPARTDGGVRANSPSLYGYAETSAPAGIS